MYYVLYWTPNKDSLQTKKFFAEKRMQRKQRKIFLEIYNFGEILP